MLRWGPWKLKRWPRARASSLGTLYLKKIDTVLAMSSHCAKLHFYLYGDRTVLAFICVPKDGLLQTFFTCLSRLSAVFTPYSLHATNHLELKRTRWSGHTLADTGQSRGNQTGHNFRRTKSYRISMRKEKCRWWLVHVDVGLHSDLGRSREQIISQTDGIWRAPWTFAAHAVQSGSTGHYYAKKQCIFGCCPVAPLPAPLVL